MNGDIGRFKAGSFKAQCFDYPFGVQIWKGINNVFDLMPLAAVVDKSIFCTHGGIPRVLPQTKDVLDAIAKVPRPLSSAQIDNNVLVLDLLWSDPAGDEDTVDHTGFGPNKRGVGLTVFGKDSVNKFFEQTKCNYLIRAHQPPKMGIKLQHSAKVLTVFSSSHYCGGNNKAACVLISDGKVHLMIANIVNPSDQLENIETFK